MTDIPDWATIQAREEGAKVADARHDGFAAKMMREGFHDSAYLMQALAAHLRANAGMVRAVSEEEALAAWTASWSKNGGFHDVFLGALRSLGLLAPPARDPRLQTLIGDLPEDARTDVVIAVLEKAYALNNKD